jgi:hypothetical protein
MKRVSGNGSGTALNQFGNVILTLDVDDASAIDVADIYNDRVVKMDA